jgi:hypothetical protein
MQLRHAFFPMLAIILAALLATQSVLAQTPAARGRSAAQPAAPAPQAPAGRGTAGSARPVANMAQLMRGILFPNSNVVFAAQSDDFLKLKSDDPSLSPNPLTSTYGGWAAVENAALALTEAANLLTIPRVCSNGKPAPVQSADWQKFVQGLRAAGLEAYKAAQSKKTDAFLDVADHMTTACGNCHDVYREKTPQQGGLNARCTK